MKKTCKKEEPVPGGVDAKYYDGQESVHEKHRSWR